MARTSWFTVLFLGFCLSRLTLAGELVSIPPVKPHQVQQTVDRAIKYMQIESAAWLNTRKCAACHHVPMPLWALSEAERQGYAIDKKFVVDTIESLLGSRDKLMASKIFPNPADPPDPRPQGRGLNMGLPFLAVAVQSMPSLEKGQKQSLKLIAEEIVNKQQPDGSWEFFATLRRPPINESQTTDAAWVIMALEGAMGSDAPESQRTALSRAIAWLDTAKLSDNHQDKVLKVLMEIRFAKPRETMQTTINELLALQRADGGWSQTVPELKSDAFATGQTLYVLSLAGYTAERAQIKRGIDFLVATQSPDGSWPMVSRSTPDGSPGSAKLLTPIICAASSWATLGLAQTCAEVKINHRGNNLGEIKMPRLINHDDEWDDDSDDDYPDFGDDEPMIPCPYCGIDIHDESERCPHCERYISNEDAPTVRKPWWIIVGVVLCLYVVYRWNVWW